MPGLVAAPRFEISHGHHAALRLPIRNTCHMRRRKHIRNTCQHMSYEEENTFVCPWGRPSELSRKGLGFRV